jgi:phosphoserine phosphatase RsbU/P
MSVDATKKITHSMATHRNAQVSIETKFQLMMELASKISSSLDLKPVLDLIIDTARKFIHYDSAEIFIIEHTGKERRIKAHTSRGYDPYLEDNCMQLRLGDGIVGWVAKTGFGAIVPDVSVDPHYLSGRNQTAAEMAAPIRINGKVIGVFNLECDRLNAYTKIDLDMLMFFANQAAISIEKAMLHEALMEKKRMEAELAVAKQVQQSLLPKYDPFFGHFEIAGFNHPSEEVGGDYFDFIKVSENRLGVVIADVSGKGVPAALVMASFRASLRGQICSECPIGRTFTQLNQMLRESNIADQFVTSFYLDLYHDRHEFVYLNAGHNPPLLLRSDGNWELLDIGNTVLGLLPNRHYIEARQQVRPGDLILLYTDGVTEAARGTEEFGVERLVEVTRKYRDLSSRELVKMIYQEVIEFSQHTSLEDDCTIVAIKVDQGSEAGFHGSGAGD